MGMADVFGTFVTSNNGVALARSIVFSNIVSKHRLQRLKNNKQFQMKIKQLVLGLSVAILCATTQFACDSKKENKAEDVQDAKEDVNEARRDGDSKEDVREEQTDLDSARKDYKEAVRDSVRNN